MKTYLILKEEKIEIEYEINHYEDDYFPSWKDWTKFEEVLENPFKYFKYIKAQSPSVVLDQDNFMESSLKEEILTKIYEETMEYKKKEREFLQYHHTGDIPSSAYRNPNYSWVEYEKKPLLSKIFVDKTGEEIEIRQSGEENRYIKKDKDGEILRDEQGDAVYLTPEEIKEKGLPLYDTSFFAFNNKKECIGYTSDEFGADGVWVLPEYQRRGIGLELLSLHRSQFKDDRKIGQMTYAGVRLVSAFFRKNN